MKFTKYFASVIKSNGVPHLNVDEYQKLFNIITLETRLNELQQLKDNERNHNRNYSLGTRIFNLEQKLNRLTMENSPANLLKYMVQESRFEN
jgi:hypothetical protein